MLNMQKDSLANLNPIILGKPFLKIVRTKVVVNADTLIMEFDGDIVNFEILDALSSLAFDFII